MFQPLPSFEQAITSYDRDLDKGHISEGERERQEVTERFPLERWPSLALEQYALGQEDSENTFCRWIEFRTQHLGSIRGGSSRKLLIYKHKDKPGWYFDPEYRDEQQAWQKVREAFVQAFEKAKDQDWDTIAELAPLQGGPALCLKVLHLYFKEEILPVYSQQHIRHFLRLMGCAEADDSSLDVIRLNRALLSATRQRPELDGWTNNEIGRLMYRWSNPREQRRIVKIAPGEDARFWNDCISNGYICVGWDEVGDLSEFESKESFRAEFDRVFAAEYNDHKPTLTKKSNELWTLMELEPGDIVVANKGISKILAIGGVGEAAYQWSPDRSGYKHTVQVEWDTSFAKEIPPQKQWALVTVAPVSAELYDTIVGKAISAAPAAPLDSQIDDIGEALQRKGQVILYGPPGTGKTYHARRFAVAWLLQHEGRQAEIQAVLMDRTKFEAVERGLSTVLLSRRVWWMVANPREWSWDLLFSEKRVNYSYGRIQRNYPLVKAGDLVIGYQSTPEKRIVALARVTKAFGVHEGTDPTIEIEPLARINNGLTYDELSADSILKDSEPIRFRNQGTLFSLTSHEAGHVLSLLAERDPDIPLDLDENETVGPLTYITFHPSYSYEDFVEGFRPQPTKDGGLSLRLENGIFKRICLAALAHPKKKFLLFIDEINRANLAKVFGELITLLEADKRDMLVTLPQSKENFCIPNNVFLVGTMNTADRSIKLLDTALRRRFAFKEMMPNIEVLRGAKVGMLPLDDFLEELNRRVAKSEGREKQIGHSFLLDGSKPVTDQDEFARRFRQEILPVLQEYCFDDYSALTSYVGSKLVDSEAQTLNYELLANSDTLLETLEEEFCQRGRA